MTELLRNFARLLHDGEGSSSTRGIGGDRPAIVDQDGTASFHEIGARALSVCDLLLEKGASGQRIGLLCQADRNWISAFWGILMAGGSAAPLSTLYPPLARRDLVARLRLTHVLTDVSSHGDAEESLGPDTRLLVMNSPVGSLDHAASLERVTALVAQHIERAKSAASQAPALLLTTSGTTGAPKGVPLGQRQVAAMTESLADAWALTPQDRLVHALPLHHLHGICVALLATHLAGGAVEFLPRFDAGRVFEAMTRSSVFMGVPTMHRRLIEYYDRAPEERREPMRAALARQRLITSGSAALPESVGRRLEELAGQYPLERYGMTEIGIVLSNPLGGTRVAGSVGYPLGGVQVRIVDERGNDAAPDQSGELWFRGPTVFAGYDADPEATRSAFEGDWFKTGDTAAWWRTSTDAGDKPDSVNRAIKILGRTCVDIIKSGGYKLSALQIEEVLRQHREVEDVAVVGTPNEDLGQAVTAAVQLRNPRTSSDELRQFAAERLPRYAVPRSFHIVRQLPRNPLGKVLKTQITFASPSSLSANAAQTDTTQTNPTPSSMAQTNKTPTRAVDSLFEQLGGEPVLRRTIDTFVDRIFDDSMIGFLFRKADRDRVKAKEYEFAANHLGADVAYTGKPLQQAHGKHPIMGGHFMRRLQILKLTLDEFQVPEPVKAHWVRHTERLRPLITPDRTDECRGSPLGPGKVAPKSGNPEQPPGQHTVKLRRG